MKVFSVNINIGERMGMKNILLSAWEFGRTNDLTFLVEVDVLYEMALLKHLSDT